MSLKFAGITGSDVASHAVVSRGVVLPCGEEGNTTPLKTTAWEARSDVN